MKKSKTLCVLGSATFAPLSMVGLWIVIGLLLKWFGITIPMWLAWVGGIAAIISMPWAIWDFYQWFFQKCYKPSAD
jgi:Na+/citrate or Na+/malate symporter